MTPVRQGVWGERSLSITGTDFPTSKKVICRFIFPSSKASVDLAGQFKSGSELICSTPRHLLGDNEIQLHISFNNQEYYEVTSLDNTLQYSEKARILKLEPTFGFADQ